MNHGISFGKVEYIFDLNVVHQQIQKHFNESFLVSKLLYNSVKFVRVEAQIVEELPKLIYVGESTFEYLKIICDFFRLEGFFWEFQEFLQNLAK